MPEKYASTSYAVHRLWLDDDEVDLESGLLYLRQDTLAGDVPGRKGWDLRARLRGFRFYETTGYTARAELDNGEVLVGGCILVRADGTSFDLRSNGAWTGVSGW